MDEIAKKIVTDYILKEWDITTPKQAFSIFIVWKCKILQNFKYLISTTIPDGMYYELTYNGDCGDWYLDAYKKFKNVVIKECENNV